MPSYPVGLSVPNRALITVSSALQRNRKQLGTRWRRLTVGRQFLLVLAHLRKGETYTDIDALTAAGVHMVVDSGYRGAGPTFDLPQRRRRAGPETGQRQRLSDAQRAVNAAHAAQFGSGERTGCSPGTHNRFALIEYSPPDRWGHQGAAG